MYLAEIPPKSSLRFIKRDGKLVLQQLSYGRRDFKDYTIWLDVPVIEEDRNEPNFIGGETICD